MSATRWYYVPLSPWRPYGQMKRYGLCTPCVHCFQSRQRGQRSWGSSGQRKGSPRRFDLVQIGANVPTCTNFTGWVMVGQNTRGPMHGWRFGHPFFIFPWSRLPVSKDKRTASLRSFSGRFPAWVGNISGTGKQRLKIEVFYRIIDPQKFRWPKHPERL